MKIVIKIKDIEFEVSDSTDRSIYYSVNELKEIITHIVEEHNKIKKEDK
jgi:hypothetical protein